GTSTEAGTEATAAGRAGSTIPSTAPAWATGTRLPRRSTAAGIGWRHATARTAMWRAAATAGRPAVHAPRSSPPAEASKRRRGRGFGGGGGGGRGGGGGGGRGGRR